MPKPLPLAQVRRFQETFQAFLDEHQITQDQLVRYLRPLNVHKGSVSKWCPAKPGASPKASAPSKPTLPQLGFLLGRLLTPEKLSNPAHQVTPEQARLLFSAFLRLHDVPKPLITTLTSQSQQLTRYKKVINWHDRLIKLHQEIATTLIREGRTEDDVARCITLFAMPTVVQFFHDLYGVGDVHKPRRFRAAIYTRREQIPTELGILWAEGFEHESAAKLHDRFYCGDDATAPDDPLVLVKGGLAGWVFIEGQGQFINNAPAHPRFLDQYGEKRTVPPYDAVLLALIRDPEHESKMGLLCVDAKGYAFTKDDLILVNRLAKIIGWLLHETQTPYAAH